MSARPLVVVIEDDADLRNLVLYNLRAYGFEVHGAATAREGLAICALHQPAVVVIDRMLDDTDGVVVCECLRSDVDLEDLAILFLSARGSPLDRRMGFAAGGDDYIVKPFAVDDLVERVRALAALSAERRSLHRILRASA